MNTWSGAASVVPGLAELVLVWHSGERAVSRDLSVRNVWEAQKLRRALVEPSLN